MLQLALRCGAITIHFACAFIYSYSNIMPTINGVAMNLKLSRHRADFSKLGYNTVYCRWCEKLGGLEPGYETAVLLAVRV